MARYPVNQVVVLEARRLAAEDLGRDIFEVAEILSEIGHHGPDGEPYPLRTLANLLDEPLKMRRVEHIQAKRRGIFAPWDGSIEEERVAIFGSPPDVEVGDLPVEFADFDECAAAVKMLFPDAGTAAEVRADLDEAARALLGVVGPQSVLVRGCRVSRTDCADCVMVRASLEAKAVIYALQRKADRNTTM